MDYIDLFGYLYWLTGSRSAAVDVTVQARRLQIAGAHTHAAAPDALWSLATTLVAALPEERRRPGWLPLGEGPDAPPLLRGLAALDVRKRAAVLLREGLGWPAGEAEAAAGAAAEPALAALAAALGVDRDAARAAVKALAWPRPAPGELSRMQARIVTEDGHEVLPPPPPPSRLGRAAERVAIALAVVIVVFLAWRNLAETAREPAPDADAAAAETQVPLTPEPVAEPTATPYPPVTDPNVPVSAVEWLRANHSRISGAGLASVVGDARVVVLGDGTWGPNGAAEYHRELQHVTRHLVRDLGFDTVILQASAPAGELADMFMDATGGGFAALARTLAGPWATRELAEGLEGLRTASGVEVAGFLPPEQEGEWLIRDTPLYGQLARENLERLLDKYAARKVIIWATDFAGSGLPALPELVAGLASTPERPIVRIGFLFGEGDMLALQAPASRRTPRMVVHQVDAPLPQSHERVLAATGIPTGPRSGLLADLRRLDAAGEAWPAEQRYTRRITSGYNGCFHEDYWQQTGLLVRYDAVVYVDRVTPATLLEAPATPGSVPDNRGRAAATCVHAPQNLDFSRGNEQWVRLGTRTGQYRAGTDAETNRGYVRALDGSPEGVGRLYQSFRGEGYAGRTISLASRCRADGDRPDARLFIEARGPGGEVLAEQREPIRPEVRFTDCQVSLAIPPGVTRIDLGLELSGRGETYAGALTFKVE